MKVMSSIKATAAATKKDRKVLQVIIHPAECLVAASSLLSPYFNCRRKKQTSLFEILFLISCLRQHRPKFISAAWLVILNMFMKVFTETKENN